MSAKDPRAPGDPPNPPARRSQFLAITGLFVTFGGLVTYGLQVPTQPAALSNVVPWLAVGFLGTWIGGVLAGNSLQEPPLGLQPALRGQVGIAGLATIAGVLSGGVVVRSVGPWSHPDAGVPVEIALAVSAVGLVWVGGFLMGRSMRRFVRRHHRGVPPLRA